MALFESSFFSESLGMGVSVNIVLPQTAVGQIGMKGAGSPDGCPVLYLLHGLSDDHSTWLRRTSVERYAAAYGLAVVMPNAHRSFYTDMHCGLKYWTYISEELPKIMGAFFKVSQKPEDTFVAGLSMGGYGALKLAFSHPDRYAAAGCFSSLIRPEFLAGLMPDRVEEYNNVFGSLDAIRGSQNDLYHLSSEAAKNHAVLPKLYLACGTEDFLYQENLDFKAHLEKLSLPFAWFEEPGTHEWGFWDKRIQDFLKILPIRKN